MQDIQSIGNRFGGSGGGGGGDRRFKPNYHQDSLKCPRCGSINTKFCYYNNYNLSQPRFFCKGCRRYWTKGGVLRNVPVGGGSRKTKRSKKKSGNGNRKPSSHSSSTGSSIVAANVSPEMTPFTPVEALPTGFDQSFGPLTLDQCSTDTHQLFSDLGTFRSLMTSFSDGLPVPEVSPLTHQRDQDQVVGTQNWDRQQWFQGTDDVMDSFGLVDDISRASNGGDAAAEDWGLFDNWLSNPDHQLNYFL